MKGLLSTLFLLGLFFTGIAQDNWSHFRGNQLDGHASGSGYPTVFGEDSNVVWKAPIPDLGWSSPVVWGNQVWLTTATVDGHSMWAICLDINTSVTLKEILMFTPDTVQSIHSTNSYATSTSAIEDGFVYVHYGTYGTACINTRNYESVWKRTDLNCQHMQGAASSLMIYKNLLIVHIEGTDVQYIAALDKATGKTVWKTERPHKFYDNIVPVYRKAYTTPIVVTVDGRDQLISNGAQMCISYDAATGKELWSVWYGYDSTVGMPLAYGGLVYFNSGWIAPEEADKRYVRFFAVDPRGSGDVTTTHVKWELSEDVPQISTPVIVEGKMYMVHERGALSCVDALTGKIIWKDKLKGQFNASPIYAGGYIYFPEVSGKIFVIKPGDKFELVAENKVTGMIKATPAFVNGNILLRTKSHLYKFASQKPAR